jgi:aryl carrier-like protein
VTCVQIGTGKTQAGLLIELRAGTPRNNETFDSIWTKIEESNALAPSKSRLSRKDVAFADESMPFVRTDKKTVKRHATLLLYADTIERFYKSREEDQEPVDIDTASIDTIVQSLRHVLAESLPAVHEASAQDDLFDLGLDSLSVFRFVNAIRDSTGLRHKLAPRDFYANPTLGQFAAVLARLTCGATTPEEKATENHLNQEMAALHRMSAQQKSRLSFKMNPLDYVNPNHYMGINLYFRLCADVSFEEVYRKLQKGLQRALRLVPALDGELTFASEREMGYKKGDLRLVIPPLAPLDLLNDEFIAPRQLMFADLSKTLPSYEHLQRAGFLPSAAPDDLLLPCDPFPAYPADVVVARANFVEGGCILAANFHHGCLDAVGVMIALKVWAESCQFLDGDESSSCDWLDPESSNHSLPEILHDLDMNRRLVSEVDPNVWGFLPFLCPDQLRFALQKADCNDVQPANSGLNGETVDLHVKKALPPPQTWSHGLTGFPPPVDPAGRSLRTAMFLITPEKLKLLQQEVLADSEAKGTITSMSDIVQAFFWRVAIRARYRVAVELHGTGFGDDETAVLELPVDGRPHFSPLLPSTYMGSMLVMNRAGMSLKELVSPHTSVAKIACVLREAAARITPSLFSDCFTLLRAMPHYEPKGQFSLADMGLEGMHAMISNMILFQPGEISFGEGFFAGGGSPEVLRPQIQRGSSLFRFLVVHPLRSDGGVELVLGTLPEELEMLKTDEEFARFATLADY